MNKYTPWIALIIVVIGLAGVIAISKAARNYTPSSEKILRVQKTDWTEGPADAKVTMIEYTNFACINCYKYYRIVKTLREDFPNDLRVVYRHFPTTADQNSALAARAAEAAGAQGKFWEMHDLLYKNQDGWKYEDDPRARFGVFAGKLNLDVEQFVGDLISTDVQAKVAKSEKGGRSLGITAIPIFYINGQKVGNIASYGDMKNLISEKIGTTTPSTTNATTTP